MALHRMSERALAVNDVDVAATLAPARDVTAIDQLTDDPPDRSLGDPDALRYVTQPRARILGDREQDQAMVGEERPGDLGWICVFRPASDGRMIRRLRDRELPVLWLRRRRSHGRELAHFLVELLCGDPLELLLLGLDAEHDHRDDRKG
jgi:hypothetical protein